MESPLNLAVRSLTKPEIVPLSHYITLVIPYDARVLEGVCTMPQVNMHFSLYTILFPIAYGEK